MIKSQIVTFRDVVLFDFENSINTRNHLRPFLLFLKQFDYEGQKNFSYIERSGQNFIKNITICENIALSISKIFSSSCNNEFKKFLAQNKNTSLSQIIQLLPSVNNFSNKLSAEQLKLAAIVLAIIENKKYIFCEKIDENLSDFSKKLVKSALVTEANLNNRIILLSTDHKKYWSDVVTKVAFKKENTPFTIEPTVSNESNDNFAKLGIAV